jgi:hypothetical protein
MSANPWGVAPASVTSVKTSDFSLCALAVIILAGAPQPTINPSETTIMLMAILFLIVPS